jgi:rod shape-determining protein MreD
MKENLLYILIITLLVFFQIFVFNQIHLFGYGCIFVYILFILIAPLSFNKMSLVFLGFIVGFLIDYFSNSYGIHAAASTLIAYIRPKIVKLFFGEAELENKIKFFSEITFGFYKYVVIMVLIHHFTLFMLEAFSFKLILLVVLKSLISSILSIIFIFLIQTLFLKTANAR